MYVKLSSPSTLLLYSNADQVPFTLMRQYL
jgi:hypothetical protein